MRIRVYMRDGRTCYRLAKRAQLRELLKRQPDNEEPTVSGEVTMWNGVACVFGDFRPGCSARRAENSDPFLAATEPELPVLTVRVCEDLNKPRDERQIVEVLLDGRPMGQLPFTAAVYRMEPRDFGKLTIELLAQKAEVTANG